MDQDYSERQARIDEHVGRRIRERRIMLGLSQQALASLIGVTYQQAHKYERGINRLSASRLFDISVALGVDISFFFDGIEGGDAGGGRLQAPQRQCLEFVQNFNSIDNERHRDALSVLTRVLAGSQIG
ncbi:MAG: helix-turn-helix domain-containing protein [Actinomycetota bacterium]